MGKNTHLYFHKRGVATFQLPAKKAAQTEKCNGAIKSNNSVFEAFWYCRHQTGATAGTCIILCLHRANPVRKKRKKRNRQSERKNRKIHTGFWHFKDIWQHFTAVNLQVGKKKKRYSLKSQDGQSRISMWNHKRAQRPEDKVKTGYRACITVALGTNPHQAAKVIIYQRNERLCGPLLSECKQSALKLSWAGNSGGRGHHCACCCLMDASRPSYLP